jgi:hypothetical protein
MTAIINLQKKSAKSLLSSLTSLLKTEAYLAGGMLRDHHFQRSGNDFDVYVKRNHAFEYDAFMTPLLNGSHGYSDFRKMKSKHSYEYGNKDSAIYQIYEGNFTANHVKTETQVIVLNTVNPREYIEEYFCCSLSKVWQTQKSKPVYTEDFMDTIRTNLIKFDFSKLKEVNYDYINKILGRYPEFDLDEDTKKYYIDKFTREAYWTNSD